VGDKQDVTETGSSSEQKHVSLQTAVTFAGGLVALAAYLYLLGGLVLWLKFTAARLPTDDTVRVLDGNRLLTVGIKALIFEIVLLTILLLLALLTWRLVRESEDLKDPQKKWVAWKLVLHGVIVTLLVDTMIAKLTDAPTLAAILISVAAGILWVRDLLPALLRAVKGHRKTRWTAKTGLTVAAVLIAISLLAAPAGVGLLVLLLFLHLSHFLEKLPTVREPRKLVPAVVVLAAGLSLVVAAYLATPPVALDRAVLFMEGGGAVRGGFVGQSSDGIFLATCNPSPINPKVSELARLRIIAPSGVRRIALGGRRYFLDYGRDPSLVDLGRYLIERDMINELTDTVPLDVRDPKLVCGLRRILVISRTAHARRSSQLKVWVAGAGALRLSGFGIQKQSRQVAERGFVALPLKPRPHDLRMVRQRCRRSFQSQVEVQFRLHDGDIDRRSADVAVALPRLRKPKSGGAAVSCARSTRRTNAR
jgi:hypothetical protein